MNRTDTEQQSKPQASCKPTQDKCLSLTASQVREIGERCWPQGGSHFAKGMGVLRATWLADTEPWR